MAVAKWLVVYPSLFKYPYLKSQNSFLVEHNFLVVNYILVYSSCMLECSI